MDLALIFKSVIYFFNLSFIYLFILLYNIILVLPYTDCYLFLVSFWVWCEVGGSNFLLYVDKQLS